MTREHLYPRIWRSQSCTAKQISSLSDVVVNTAGTHSYDRIPVTNPASPIADVNAVARYSLQFFTETFDHHLTQTPVEHIDRAKVITGSKVIDFPTMRIARLLEELSLTATDKTDQEEAISKIAAVLGCPDLASLEEIVDSAKGRMSLLREREKQVVDRNATISALNRDAAVLRSLNSTQAASIRTYQKREDERDAQPDAIQDLQCRVGKIERCMGEAGRASPGTHG